LKGKNLKISEFLFSFSEGFQFSKKNFTSFTAQKIERGSSKWIILDVLSQKNHIELSETTFVLAKSLSRLYHIKQSKKNKKLKKMKLKFNSQS
jgi:hypothetical protein